MTAGFGVNLIASVSGNAGLGVSARNVALSLQRHGVPMVILDAVFPWGDKHPVTGIEAPFARGPEDLRHAINLYILALPAYDTLFQNNPYLLGRSRFHAAWVWWEASAIPPRWAAHLGRLDAVIAGSGFIAQTLANGLALTPVIEAEHPLELPTGIAPARDSFGMPAGATVFTASFDPHSDVARKNPYGTIQAFRAAFPGVADVRLVIRVNHGDTPYARSTLEEMARVAGGDARISFLVEPMTYEDVLSFFASGDAYVSLHRGEGLGLGLMEAMALFTCMIRNILRADWQLIHS